MAEESGGAASSSQAAASVKEAAAGKKALLHVLLLGGRAFTPDMETPAEEGGEAEAATDTLSVCLQFGEQRWKSKRVAYAAEPALCEGVLFELPPPDAAAALTQKASSRSAGCTVVPCCDSRTRSRPTATLAESPQTRSIVR